MARTSRQSKILELISTREIETQDELVSYLKAANFDITQATISRDIKELGLIKILGSDGRYKYALVDSGEQAVSNKNISIFRESIISVRPAQNLCILKTAKSMAGGICAMIDKLNLNNVLGCVNGDDTVMIILPTPLDADKCARSLEDLIR